jgi:hypothetical protein
MSSSLNSLKETASGMHPLHRVWIDIGSTDTWYAVIREANTLYGNHNWRGQPRIRRKLENNWSRKTVRVWFDVPDPNFATWVSVKHSVIARVEGTK